MKHALKVVYSRSKLSRRVAQLGSKITRDYAGRSLDVLILLENAFVFGADLVRHIRRPVVCHFVRSEIRDLADDGRERREVFFAQGPRLKGRNVLLVDAVLHSGVTQEFLMRRLMEGRPRTLRLAVLVDRPQARRVDLRPDYFGFSAASNYLAGYGLATAGGTHRNLPYVGLAGRGFPRGRSSGGRMKQAR